MRIALLGYGTIASIHARQLVHSGVTVEVVFGPRAEKAEAFAFKHGIKKSTADLQEALSMVDAVVVCSPSRVHYGQARLCVESGKHTLVELPACENLAEAEDLADRALESGVVLRCAHTSRYLIPYRRIRESIFAGILGSMRQLTYVRHHVPIRRSWKDDALLHHAAHPMDLLMEWFGAPEPVACLALPKLGEVESVSILASLPGGAPAAISICYVSCLPRIQMTLVGDLHSLETDGFSYVHSDLEQLEFRGEEREIYVRAIRDQDADFVTSCRGEQKGVTWRETLKLMKAMDKLRVELS